MPNHFIKYIEQVYEGYENFSFVVVNYEITEKDLKFCHSSKLEISEKDFEKVIDVFEKLAILDNDQSMAHLTSRFYEIASKEY